MATYINAGSIRPGMIINHNKNIWRVMTFETVKPGKGGAYAQVKMRNLTQGNQTEVRFRTEEKVERAVLEQVEMEYLYEDTAGFCFMNLQSYEQMFFNKEILEDAMDYLVPNTKVKIEFNEGKPIGIELPRIVELTVTKTDPLMKTATITSQSKPATLETGKVVQVPAFIEEGEKVRVDTAEGKYMERAK
ncbi:MAG: elongation factor P [Nitrospinota bacterium]|nr:elongation factor P [Nitrospinota bacterium]